MPEMNMKNMAISPAANDLGLGGMGDSLAAQLKTLEDERKKKLLAGQSKGGLPNQYGDSVLSPAASALFL